MDITLRHVSSSRPDTDPDGVWAFAAARPDAHGPGIGMFGGVRVGGAWYFTGSRADAVAHATTYRYTVTNQED